MKPLSRSLSVTMSPHGEEVRSAPPMENPASLPLNSRPHSSSVLPKCHSAPSLIMEAPRRRRSRQSSGHRLQLQLPASASVRDHRRHSDHSHVANFMQQHHYVRRSTLPVLPEERKEEDGVLNRVHSLPSPPTTSLRPTFFVGSKPKPKQSSKTAEKPKRLKVVLVGNSGSGKTSLMQAARQLPMTQHHVPTSLETQALTSQVDGQEVEMAVWDCGGEDKYTRIRELAYKGCHAVIVCYSTADKTSLRSVREHWQKELEEQCPDLPRVLVGCKLDAKEDEVLRHRMSSRREGRSTANNLNFHYYAECSAIKNSNVEAIFRRVASLAKQHNEQNPN